MMAVMTHIKKQQNHAVHGWQKKRKEIKLKNEPSLACSSLPWPSFFFFSPQWSPLIQDRKRTQQHCKVANEKIKRQKNKSLAQNIYTTRSGSLPLKRNGRGADGNIAEQEKEAEKKKKKKGENAVTKFRGKPGSGSENVRPRSLVRRTGQRPRKCDEVNIKKNRAARQRRRQRACQVRRIPCRECG